MLLRVIRLPSFPKTIEARATTAGIGFLDLHYHWWTFLRFQKRCSNWLVFVCQVLEKLQKNLGTCTFIFLPPLWLACLQSKKSEPSQQTQVIQRMPLGCPRFSPFLVLRKSLKVIFILLKSCKWKAVMMSLGYTN